MVPEQPPTLSLDEEKPAVAYPKMVLHTQASLGIGHQITARFWQDLKPSDLHWTLSDFGWAKAAWGGQIVKAFVILVPGQTGSQDLVAELQDHCKQVSAPYKYPREIEFVSELPKTISGKIRRVELRQREITISTTADPG
jgi:acyl-coenzyme A synthetase/AMP-(fatty) acid ligase